MTIERILVPVDGGALDGRASRASIDLATQLKAAIVGFTVEPFAGDTPSGEAALRWHAREVLTGFERAARAAGVPFTGVATQASRVSDAILAAAEEQRCDMIVMATHGRNALGRILSGSHTRDVMARATLPVLVLP